MKILFPVYLPYLPIAGNCDVKLVYAECWFTGQSLVLWAQNPDQHVGGEWSWQDAREHYYIALTGRDFTGSEAALLPDETEKEKRERYFANTFRAVGQQMHFVHDATVPEHVRNDIHVLPAYEALVEEIRSDKKYGSCSITQSTNCKTFKDCPAGETCQRLWDTFLTNPVTFDKSILDIPLSDPSAPVPIARIIDTDKYNDTNPGITIDANCSITKSIICSTDSDCPADEECVKSIGISEYTNANFTSPDTIFTEEKPTTDKHYFPYPRKSSTDLQNFEDEGKLPETVTEKDGIPDTSFWIAKTGDGETIDHFVKPRYLTRNDAVRTYEGDLYKRSFYLDEKCYEDYAEKLIPRAVGYSAGLLEYFFRGEMEAVNPEAIKDGSGNITGINLKVKNNTPNESMEPRTPPDESKFIISYQYNLSGSDVYGTSDEVVLNEVIDSNSVSTSEFTFNFSNPIPSDALNVKYWLVYRGKLGNEEDAVVGRVLERIYFVIIPVDHATREMLGKQFYYNTGIGTNMIAISESELPFETFDDGAYWDAATSSWIPADPAGLGVPLSVGGPQYIAKYWDEANQRVRFVLNLSYEKEAYQAFNRVYKDTSDSVIKDFYNVVFEGSPLLGFGAYEENPGYMEYLGEPYYGLYSLRPIPAMDPAERFFSMYRSLNFMDTFLEYDTSKFYYFDETVDVDKQNIPKDADAPFPSVISISKSGNVFNVEIPKIFNYTRPSPYWPGSAGYGSSGVDNYTASIGSSMSPDSSENKCLTEDNNCGNIYDSAQGSSSVYTVYDIPYNLIAS